MRRPEYCETDESQDPCKACGATLSGNDRAKGVCQARNPFPKPQPLLYLVLRDRDTGKLI